MDKVMLKSMVWQLMRHLHYLSVSLLVLLLSAQSVDAVSAVPHDDIIGVVTRYTTKPNDNLYDIARRHDIGIVELLAANPGVDPWAPEVGTLLNIATMHVLPNVPRKGIVINLSELRLFYYEKSGEVTTFPIGIGREGWETPTGQTRIIRKRENPTWTPPLSIRAENPDLPDIVPAGPDNPLGAYALTLDWDGYVIHGTNRPYGVGKRSSHGCIRLYPEDIALLYEKVDVGTPVTIIDMAFKLGWRGDTLFLEVTPTQEQTDEIAQYLQPAPINIPEIYDAVNKTAGKDAKINWYAVDEATAQRSGIPTAIAQR